MAELKTGIMGKETVKVAKENTASTVGSGLLPVFATPSMIALMEKTASESVAPYLEEGLGTVGTHIDVMHTSATPLGMEIVCQSELIEIDGRRLVFSVVAFDECGEIGKGTHERFIINNEKFLAKAVSKKESKNNKNG
ncbi:MAG: thioesterase family protein [Clostridia bacterium]|nr:thioesterase family protein [Clostridia bacterium]